MTIAEPREPSAVVVKSQEEAASKAVMTTQTKAAAQAPQQRPPLLSTILVRATTMITKMRTQARILAQKPTLLLSSTTKEKRNTTTRARPIQSLRTPRHLPLSSTTTAALVDSEAGRAHLGEVSRAADRPLPKGAEDTAEEVATTEARAPGLTPTEV